MRIQNAPAVAEHSFEAERSSLNAEVLFAHLALWGVEEEIGMLLFVKDPGF